MIKQLDFKDILLVPRYSALASRSLADTTVEFLGRKFALPVTPANMESVIDEKIAYYFSENNLFYVMHRFNGFNHYDFVKKANEENWNLISISIGVNDDTEEFKKLYHIVGDKFRVDYITIDVAHAWHKKMYERIKWVKNHFPNSKIIAQSIATCDAADSLQQWGADAIGVGVGGGSICLTKHQTGFSYPMFSSLQNCSRFSPPGYSGNSPFIKIPIVANGGIKYLGDIAKAIKAGATMIMSGRLFAPCVDSPAKIIDGKKQYFGSTSFQAKKINKHIEGKSDELPLEVTVGERLAEIKMALQSSISYAGGNKLEDLKKVDYIIV